MAKNILRGLGIVVGFLLLGCAVVGFGADTVVQIAAGVSYTIHHGILSGIWHALVFWILWMIGCWVVALIGGVILGFSGISVIKWVKKKLFDDDPMAPITRSHP